MTPPDDMPAPWRSPDTPLPAGAPVEPREAAQPPATPDDELAGERRDAPPAEPPVGDGGKGVPPKKGGGGDGGGGGGKRSSNPPNKIGEAILEKFRLTTDDTGTYLFENNYWHEVSRKQIGRWAMDFDGVYFTKGARRNEIVDFVQTRSYVPKIEWSRVGDDEIPFANEVHNVRDGDVRAHRAEDYLDRVLAVPFRPGAKCPAWLKALADWWGSANSEEALALQEFVGYIMLAHAKFKKALVLYGDEDCGKGVIVRVLRELVGADFCCQLSVEFMDDPGRRSVIKGKALNIITELSSQAIIRDDGFKALVSQEDPVLLDDKFKAREFYMPTAKHVISTNNLPRVTDRTNATISRMLILHMPRTFHGEEKDMTLGDRLVAELPGIALWALDGAKRLVLRGGQFSQPQSGSKVLDELRLEANPVRQFVTEICTMSSTSAVPLAQLVPVYNRWNADAKKIGIKALSRMLTRAGFAVKSVRHGDRVWSSLVGFWVMDERVPPSLVVEEHSAADPRDTIEGREPTGVGSPH
jgi:P4 family phage/plasmid primase-like protien